MAEPFPLFDHLHPSEQLAIRSHNRDLAVQAVEHYRTREKTASNMAMAEFWAGMVQWGLGYLAWLEASITKIEERIDIGR